MGNKTKSELVAENSSLRARLAKLESQSPKRSLGKGTQFTKAMAERKRAQQALKDSEVRYRRLFETAKDGILLLNADTGQITDVNPFLVELLGYTRTEFLGKKLWEIGPFKDIAASQIAFRELQKKQYIRYDELPLETKNGRRSDVEFVSNVYQVNGHKVIQCNIRDITERVKAKDTIRKANQDLSLMVTELQKHEREMRLVNRMIDLLQTCKTVDEAHRVIALAAEELFPGQRGGLATMHASGQYLETVAWWGSEPLLESVFSLEDCWAMRRGQLHWVENPGTSVMCRHFVRQPETGYLCLPLVVQGETMGLFCLDAPAENSAEQSSSRNQLVVTIGEGIKVSLSNLKLRDILREQATRDPLTGLFNRRYLHDTLPRELNRALRHNAPMCLAMLDLDHFKHINDTFGHEAGDLLLRELGRALRDNVRKSDIVCRYGGEEFVLVLPDSRLEDGRKHLEKIRTQVKELPVRYGEQLLGTVTVSIGVAQSPEHGLTADDLLRAADEAMYAAKQAGRDCVVAYNNDRLSETG
ncbi:MAG: diguanylate cyclase [Chloroflexi bacterium]|nr:diguanylate cyclase [Chloroflexota bacterium]